MKDSHLASHQRRGKTTGFFPPRSRWANAKGPSVAFPCERKQSELGVRVPQIEVLFGVKIVSREINVLFVRFEWMEHGEAFGFVHLLFMVICTSTMWLKGTVHPNMIILSAFTQPQIV